MTRGEEVYRPKKPVRGRYQVQVRLFGIWFSYGNYFTLSTAIGFADLRVRRDGLKAKNVRVVKR